MIFHETSSLKINQFIDDNRSNLIDFLKELVNLEGKHGEKECLLNTAGFLKNKFEELGLKTEIIEVGENNAPIVTAVLNDDIPGKEIVFSGHYDTVFAAESRGENPFYIKDGKAYGPGVCDMKSGIAIAFFVVKALKEFGFREAPVRLFFLGDEEVNHQGGVGIEKIKEYTKDILVDFNMENRYESGELCIGRKGCYEFLLKVYGVASHPGHAYDAGRNAIEEMSHKVIELQAVTPKNKDRDYSVNVGTIKGGTVINGVPDYCEAAIDVRVKSFDALDICEKKMREICKKTFIDGTTSVLLRTDDMIPFKTTEQVKNTYEIVKSISDAIGGTITGSIVVGGASDAAYIAANDSKVICQCGASGAFTHNIKEYAWVDSLYEAVRLFIHTVYNHKLF
ncbi:MAG: M20/M25/M40 family metallo-hydrolase [Peptostreptococcaceae bacterium]|nr:M20/M25/M40 family metallo-hydrolase [Peptostreptococcaceae bacterium]